MTIFQDAHVYRASFGMVEKIQKIWYPLHEFSKTVLSYLIKSNIYYINRKSYDVKKLSQGPIL